MDTKCPRIRYPFFFYHTRNDIRGAVEVKTSLDLGSLPIGLSVLLFGLSDAVELGVDLQQLFLCKVNVTHILHSHEVHKSKPAPPQIWMEQVFISLIYATI